MKSQKYNLIIVFVLVFVNNVVNSQPKLSVDLGLGLYQPILEGFDENDAFK